jgi:prevent-host-death family protein
MVATMAIGMRELKNRVAEVLRTIEERRSGVVVTRRGRPTALILPIDAPEAEDYVLSHAPEVVQSLRDADEDLRAGRTVTLGEYRKRRGV